MKPGEVYWVNYHDPTGRVQGGRRPGIVLQDDGAFPTRSPMVLTVPLTSQTAALRFPAALQINPTPLNGLTAVSVALLFQLRAIDRNWVDAKLGELDAAVLDDLLKTLDRFLGR